MPRSKKTSEEDIKHSHIWIPGRNESELLCKGCDYIRISVKELERREKEWNSYFELVKTTSSYLDYQEMKIAFAERNHPKIKEVQAKIKQRTHVVTNRFGDKELELDDPLPKPSFPDPSTWNKYIVNTPILGSKD